MLAPGSDANGPLARLGLGFFKFYPYAHWSAYAPTSVTASLVAKPTYIIIAHRIGADISKSRNIDSIVSTSVVVFIIKTLHVTRRTCSKMMIHKIVSDLFTAISKSIGKYIGCTVKQYPGCAKSRCVQKNDICIVFLRFIRFGIQNPDSG